MGTISTPLPTLRPPAAHGQKSHSQEPHSQEPQPSVCRPRWRQELKAAVRDPAELCRLVELAHLEPTARRAAERFPLFVPQAFIRRIRPGDPADPLLRQVLPLNAELDSAPGFSADPVGDGAATLSPGLLQKYASRALIVATGACAVHCRYCFRREFPYSESPKAPTDWQAAVDRIAADARVTEVILSGGDPLTLRDRSLADLARRLEGVPQLRRLRVHTRLPIMIPSRVTSSLLAWLTQGRLTPIVVLHANHAAELDDAVAAAIGRLSAAGVLLLNQSVLLAGVNDSVDALAELSERLLDLRVTPYYLHQLDRVRGAAHFEVPEARGHALVAELRARLPGYAVPRYVREDAGAAHKTVLA
jgi:EF-P beta-lysylation protein EpmB